MADQTLTPEQLQKLSNVMSAPTHAQQTPNQTPASFTPPAGASVPLPVSYKVADLPGTNPNIKTVTSVTNPTNTTVVGSEKIAGQKKSGSILPMLFLLLGVILLTGYAYFWMKYFGLHFLGF